MNPNYILLYDSGRVPVLLRLPALLLSILMLWIISSIISKNIGGGDLLFHDATGHIASIWSIIPALFLAWFFMYLWFAQKQIFYDAAIKQIVIPYNFIIKRHYRKLSLENLKGVYVTRKIIRASNFCDIGLLIDSRRIWLTREYGNAEHIAGELANILGVQVIME